MVRADMPLAAASLRKRASQVSKLSEFLQLAGLGFGGEGYTSFTIASPTGEGLTGPRSFSRERRCVVVDQFRII